MKSPACAGGVGVHAQMINQSPVIGPGVSWPVKVGEPSVTSSSEHGAGK
jgi:hypothetical protein